MQEHPSVEFFFFFSFSKKIMFIEYDNFVLDKTESFLVPEFFDSIFDGFFC